MPQAPATSAPAAARGSTLPPGRQDVVDERELTLERAVQIALRNNPALEARARAVEAAAGRLEQARLWPNPQFGVSAEDGRLRRTAGFGEGKIVGQLSQQLPISGRLGAQTELARRRQELAVLERELARRRLVAAVRRAFFGVLAAQRQLEVAQRNLEIAQQLRARADERVRTGAAAETERLRADIELARARTRVQGARGALERAEQQLAVQLGDVDLRVQRYVGTLPEQFPALAGERLEREVAVRFPAIVLAERRIETARAAVALADRSWRPEPVLSVGSGRLREGGGSDRLLLEWGLSFSLPVFNRNQGLLAARRAELRQAQAQARAARNDAIGRLRRALVRYERLRAQYTQYREHILPRAEQTLVLVQDGFRQGKLTQIDVLDAQRTVAAARSAYVDLLQALASTRVELELLSGAPLDEFSKEGA